MKRNTRNIERLNEKKQFLKGHERELFVKYYQTMGTARSYIKLVNFCVIQGWVSPVTRKRPTRMSCWFSMWRWAIKPENQQDAYQIYNSSLRDEGQYLSWEGWMELLDERAQVCLRDADYVRWKQQVFA